MSKEFFLKLSGERRVVTKDNGEVVFFRGDEAHPHEHEKDYLDITHYDADNGVEVHTWVFNNRELLLWITNVAFRKKDRRTLDEMNETLGDFRGHTGWNPNVRIYDTATDYENETYADSIIDDLDGDIRGLLGEEP